MKYFTTPNPKNIIATLRIVTKDSFMVSDRTNLEFRKYFLRKVITLKWILLHMIW